MSTRLERDDFSSNRHRAPGYSWSMIFSDLPRPAEALLHTTEFLPGLRAGGKPLHTFRDHALHRPRRTRAVRLMLRDPPAGLLRGADHNRRKRAVPSGR